MFATITNAVFGCVLATTIAAGNVAGIDYDNGYDYIWPEDVVALAFDETDEYYSYWMVDEYDHENLVHMREFK